METKRITLVDIAVRTRFPTSGAVVRRDAFAAVGNFDESLRAVEDRDMWARLAAKFDIVRIEEPLAWIRDTPGSMSKDPERMERYERIVIDRMFAMPELRHHRFARFRANAIMNASAALTMLRAGRPMAGFRRAVASFLWWPWFLRREELAVPLMRLRLAVASVRQCFYGAQG